MYISVGHDFDMQVFNLLNHDIILLYYVHDITSILPYYIQSMYSYIPNNKSPQAKYEFRWKLKFSSKKQLNWC